MNKILYSILSLVICSIATGQVRYQLISTRLTSYVQIGNNNLLTDCDSSFRYLKLWSNVGNTKPQIVDTADCSPYNSELLVYRSKKQLDYLIFFVTEDEYYSDIHLLYLTKDTLTKIGTLPILSNCKTCDDMVYPIDKIRVSGTGNGIIIKLLEPFKLDLGNDNYEEYQPNQLYFKVDRKSKKLISIVTLTKS